MAFRILLGLLLYLPFAEGAEPRAYSVALDAGSKPGIVFHLGYSLGTHDGRAKSITGQAVVSSFEPLRVSGEFHVPISSLETGSDSRDCHLRESLGLDYTNSDYPKEHACDHDRLPGSGKNSVVFPEIVFKILSVEAEQPLDHETKVLVNGEWAMHGVTRKASIPLLLTRDGEKFRLHGECPISLKDFGIVVKSAHVLFATISVKDTAKVEFNILLAPNAANASAPAD